MLKNCYKFFNNLLFQWGRINAIKASEQTLVKFPITYAVDYGVITGCKYINGTIGKSHWTSYKYIDLSSFYFGSRYYGTPDDYAYPVWFAIGW